MFIFLKLIVLWNRFVFNLTSGIFDLVKHMFNNCLATMLSLLLLFFSCHKIAGWCWTFADWICLHLIRSIMTKFLFVISFSFKQFIGDGFIGHLIYESQPHFYYYLQTLWLRWPFWNIWGVHWWLLAHLTGKDPNFLALLGFWIWRYSTSLLNQGVYHGSVVRIQMTR